MRSKTHLGVWPSVKDECFLYCKEWEGIFEQVALYICVGNQIRSIAGLPGFSSSRDFEV